MTIRLGREFPPMHVKRLPRPTLSSLSISGLGVAGVVLTYWTLERTDIQPVSPRVGLVMHVLTLALAAATIALAGAALRRWTRHDTLESWLARALHAGDPPPWAYVMPVSLSASWVAARIGLTTDPSANYWPAFWLWLGAMVLVLTSFVPARALQSPWRWLREVAWERLPVADVLLVVLLTAGALALRMVDLSGVPPLVHGDEEQVGFEALRAAQGDLRNMFGAGWGTNPSMGYFVYGAFIKLFGADIVSVRMGAAVWGAAGVPLVYLLLREMFGRWPALAGALFLVGYHFSLHMSRVAINVAWDTPLMAAALYFVYRGSRDGRPLDFALTGLVSGAALYFYHGTRVVPIVVVAYLVFVGVFRPAFVRANAGNFVLLALAFLVAAMPLGAYWATHQHVFWARLDEASIFNSGWFDAQRALGHSPASIIWSQVRHAYGGWFYYTDQSPSALYTVPKPLVQGVAVVPLIAGIIYALLHIDDRRYALLIVAFAVPTFLGGVLTLGPPTGQRLLSAVPAVVGLIGVGIWQLSVRVFWWRRALAALAAVGVAAGLAVADANVYFDGARHDVRWGSLTNSVAAKYMKELPAETRIYWYGLPLTGGDFSPLTLQGRPHVDVWDGMPGLLKPVESASPSSYVFLEGRDTRLPMLVERCPGGQTRTISFHAIKVLTVYELTEPNTCVPTAAAPDDFEQALSLSRSRLPVVDFTVNRLAGVQEGEPLPCGMAGNTVWYSYTAKSDTTLAADTDGSTFDTVLGAYTGAGLASLDPVDCNDDAHDVRSRVEVEARKGVTYYFQVGLARKSRPLHDGDIIRFNLTCRPDPSACSPSP